MQHAFYKTSRKGLILVAFFLVAADQRAYFGSRAARAALRCDEKAAQSEAMALA
jgi:hypothetical protein